MNLYQFFKNYLEDQISNKFPLFNFDELSLYYHEPIMYYQPEMFKIKKGEETINDMMKALAYCLTRNRYAPMANYNLDENYDVLCDVLKDFDPYYISGLTPKTIYDKYEQNIVYIPSFIPTFKYTDEYKSRFNASLLQYFEELISAAKYLIKNYKDYNSYISYINNNPEDALKQIKTISGFGDAIGKYYLNYIGSFCYFNIHHAVINLFKEVDNTVTDERSLLISLENQAKKAGVSPFELYKTVELIVRPDLFIHKKFIKSTRGKGNLANNLTKALKEALNNNEIDL